MQTILTDSGLAAVFAEVDRSTIERRLRQIDGPNADRLFLDLERDRGTGGLVWSVNYHVGPEYPKAVLFYWRDERGRPLPLSTGIVYETERLRGLLGTNVHRTAMAANDARVERANRDDRDALAEVAREHGERLSGRKKTILPRGQHLRRSRDRRRAEGEIC